MKAAPTKIKIKVAVTAILLCRVRSLKNLTFLVRAFFSTLSTSHQTIYPIPPKMIKAHVTILITGSST